MDPVQTAQVLQVVKLQVPDLQRRHGAQIPQIAVPDLKRLRHLRQSAQIDAAAFVKMQMSDLRALEIRQDGV